jgi:hypothetical protein
MVALTRDFDVFASRVTTGFSAVLFSIRYIAQARYMRALCGLLIRHYDSVLSKSTHFSERSRIMTLDIAPFAVPTRVRNSLTRGWSVCGATSSRLIACGSPNLISRWHQTFHGFMGQQYNTMKSQASAG